MRKDFEDQLSLGTIPIDEVVINLKSRDELPPVLYALQHIFKTVELRQKVFKILSSESTRIKDSRGRSGMSRWEAFVMAVVRLCLDINYDRLEDMVNNHDTLRGILGVKPTDFTLGKTYPYQTIHDNVGLITEDMLLQINEVIVKAGHSIIKKKQEGDQEKNNPTKLEVKVDSYVVETNVHFPTDLNLTWDCARKCLDMVAHLKTELEALHGWREDNSIRKKTKRLYKNAAEVHRKKGSNYMERLKIKTEEYMQICQKISDKVAITLEDKTIKHTQKSAILLIELRRYKALLDKHIDLTTRRILKGETIPHAEKMFSIFEQHTEWINKGKLSKSVELGVSTAICTDQYQFIIHHQVMQNQVDVQTSLPIAQYIQDKYGEQCELQSISFDRNYYSSTVKQNLSRIFDQVIMPKPGKKSTTVQEEESSEAFIKLRKKHSAIESNINQLEHHGVNKCPDKGVCNFRRYIALGVVAYNMHHLGNYLKKK